MEQLGYALQSTTKHNVQVRTWVENGEWWEQTTIDGVVKSFECLGPVDA